MGATLTNSQIATLTNINERPGKHTVVAIGLDYATALEPLATSRSRMASAGPPRRQRPSGSVSAQLRSDMEFSRGMLLAATTQCADQPEPHPGSQSGAVPRLTMARRGRNRS